MATVASLATRIRKLFADPDADFLTDATILDHLNEAQKRFCHRVKPLDEIHDFTITSKLARYDIPSTCLIPVWLRWDKTRTVRMQYVPPDIWPEVEEDYQGTGTSSAPDRYTKVRDQIVVGPQRPTSNSATALASGAMSSTVTTLNLTAASGTFRGRGFVKIDSEVMEYTGVATSTLTGVTRGVHGTNNTTHTSGTQITEVDMQMLYRRVATTLTTTTDIPEIPVVYHEYLYKYALYLSWIAQGNMEKASVAYKEFEDHEEATQKTIGRRSMDGLPHIQEKVRRWRGW